MDRQIKGINEIREKNIIPSLIYKLACHIASEYPPETRKVFSIIRAINNKITKLQYSKGCVFHQYVLIVNNIKKFSKYLKSQKIPFGRHYPFPIHKLKAVKNLFINKKFPYSENLAKNGISIPIDPLMKISDAFKVCKIINNYK